MKKKSKIIALLLSLMIVLTAFVGCGNKETKLKDREGTEFTVPKKVERIISTAPSNTEVLVGLGVSDKLVAVDTYSADVEGINKDITKINFRNPDAEAIIALNPDIIIASGHNRAGDEDPFKAIKEAGITVVYIPSSNSFDGIYEDIKFMADLTGTKDKGTKLIENMKKEVESIKKIGDTIKDKKKVYFEIGSGQQLYSFGNETFLNEMIETIGAENIFKDQKGWISPSQEAVISANPDVIITNEGYLDNPVKAIVDRPGWAGISAVKNNKVFEVDKNSSSRGSQNVVKALKELAKAVYPEQYE